MNIKKIISLSQIVMITIVLLNFCGSEPVKEPKKNEKSTPATKSEIKELYDKVSKHNSSIVPFYAEFGILIKTSKRKYQPDGKAYVDTKNDRLWVELFEPTLSVILFRCLKEKDFITIVIYIQEEDKDIVIKGKVDKINLGDYSPSFDINLVDLINMIQGKIPLWQKYDTIKKKSDGFLLRKAKHFQYIDLNKKESTLQKLAEFKGKERIYLLEYKNYEKQSNKKCIKKDFYFPLNGELTHFQQKWRILMGIQQIIFCPTLNDNIFKIKVPPDAKVYTEN